MLRVSRVLAFALLVLGVLISLGNINLSGQVAARAEMPEAIDPPAVQPLASGQPLIPVQALPENPHIDDRPHRVLDKKFIVIMAALGATESMRFTTRQLVLENEMAAGAPWVTTVPTHTHLVVKYAPIFMAEVAVAYEIKKRHDWLPGDRVIRKLWWLYPVAMGAIHLHNAIGNIRTQAPAGCPVAECEQQ